MPQFQTGILHHRGGSPKGGHKQCLNHKSKRHLEANSLTQNESQNKCSDPKPGANCPTALLAFISVLLFFRTATSTSSKLRHEPTLRIRLHSSMNHYSMAKTAPFLTGKMDHKYISVTNAAEKPNGLAERSHKRYAGSQHH